MCFLTCLRYHPGKYSKIAGFNSSTTGQNGCHFADGILRCILVGEKCCILIKISLKYVPKGPIKNNPALI